MTEALRIDLDLVHSTASGMVPEAHPVTLFSVSARAPKRLHQIVVLEDVQGFFKGLEVVGTQ